VCDDDESGSITAKRPSNVEPCSLCLFFCCNKSCGSVLWNNKEMGFKPVWMPTCTFLLVSLLEWFLLLLQLSIR
jgi:hypothetical protein